MRQLAPYLVLFVIVAAVAPWIGPESIDPGLVWPYLRGEGTQDGFIFFDLRVPRVALGLVTGGTLAAVGAALQVLFRNPLVEPYTLGVTGGASLGAFLTIAFPALALQWGPFSAVQLFALAGAAVAMGIIYRFSRRAEGIALHTLLLAGISISIVCMGGVLLLAYLTTPHKLMVFQRWMMGGLGTVGFTQLAALLPFLLPGLGLLIYHANHLNHLALGDEMAIGHGVDTARVHIDVFVGGGLGTAAVVATAGPIAFVGLIVPHAVRRMSGVDQRIVLPASFLLGGAVLAACDCLARTVIAPTELPVGIMTALIGGPLFVYLLVKQ